MASTYTTSLKIQQIGTGEQSGIWGTTTNTNWALIEQAVAGVSTINMGNANYTLSNLNGVSDEARNMVIVATGTNSGVRQIIAPLVPKIYIVSNQTTGGYAITIGGSSGATVSIPNSYVGSVYCDGTNFYSTQTTSAGNFSVTGNLAVVGTTTLSAALAGTSGAFSGAVSGTTGTFSSAVSGTTGTFSGAVSGTTGTFSSAVSASSYSGAGTGLTGTAASLSIGGNAATASTLTGNWVYMPTGTVVVFYQAGAPTGWTQLTSSNDAALRVVSGTGGTTGGTVGFTTAFASQAVSGSVSIATATGTVGSTALTTAQLPAHNHSASVSDPGHAHGVADPGHIHRVFDQSGSGGQYGAGNRYVAVTVNNNNTGVKDTDAAGTGIGIYGAATGISVSTGSTGSGSTHTHSLTMNAQTGTFTGNSIDLTVKYINTIICSKN